VPQAPASEATEIEATVTKNVPTPRRLFSNSSAWSARIRDMLRAARGGRSFQQTHPRLRAPV